MRYLNINPCKYVCVIVCSIKNANLKFEFIAYSS